MVLGYSQINYGFGRIGTPISGSATVQGLFIQGGGVNFQTKPICLKLCEFMSQMYLIQ